MVSKREPEKFIPTSEGLFLAEFKNGEQLEIEIYEHPVRGLCVWFNDYSAGSIDLPTRTDGDGHVPILVSPLIFIKQLF